MVPTIVRRIESDIAKLRLEIRDLRERVLRRRSFTAQGTGGGGATPQAKFIKYVE